MKNVLKVIVFAFVLGSLTSCMSLTQPVAATSNELGSKVGQSTGTIVLRLFGNVDAGIQTAAKNGGITKISTVDFDTAAGLFSTTYTCTVTGE